MRIATRLWIALLATIVLVLGFGVVTRVREEQRLLLEVTLRDRRFFAIILQAALSREHGDPLAEARALLEREEVAEAHIATRLVSTSEPLQLPRGELAPLARGEVVVGVYEDELVTYIPLEETRGAALELVEPHAVDDLLARVGWRSLWTQALALAALAGAVTLGLTRWLVGRPLERLTLLARQIGAGDLSGRTEARGHDEVAVLAREMNGMAEKLESAHKALDELGAERLAALEQLRHADRLRTVGQLASALAHELGTPLNVVSGHARTIEQEIEDEPELRASARTILEQTSRMTGILRDLLGFARRRERRSEVLELRALAEHAVRTLEPLTRRYRATIQLEATMGEVHVRADGQQLLQLLTNLLTNAMQAMPEGGPVQIAIEVHETVPPTGVHAPKGRYARVGVIDRGSGIELADLPHLFEPFFTRKSESEGTGLGLVVVEGIAREHGGWVTVESERGRGSRFDVYLPVSAPEL